MFWLKQLSKSSRFFLAVGWRTRRTHNNVAMEPCYPVRRAPLRARVKYSLPRTGIPCCRTPCHELVGRTCAMGLPLEYAGRTGLYDRHSRHDTPPHPPGGGACCKTTWHCEPMPGMVYCRHGPTRGRYCAISPCRPRLLTVVGPK